MIMLQIVAERVREARTDGFEPGCLAALLRMEGCGVRVAARSAADDAGRLEEEVVDPQLAGKWFPRKPGSVGSAGD